MEAIHVCHSCDSPHQSPQAYQLLPSSSYVSTYVRTYVRAYVRNGFSEKLALDGELRVRTPTPTTTTKTTTTTTTTTTSTARNFFSKFRSGRRGRFRQKIVEIGAILAILRPLEAEFDAETPLLGEFSRSSLDSPHNPPQSGLIPGRSA